MKDGLGSGDLEDLRRVRCRPLVLTLLAACAQHAQHGSVLINVMQVHLSGLEKQATREGQLENALTQLFGAL